MIIISPSLLASDFSRLGEELESIEECGADWAHIDVMDGHFVNNITLGPPIIKRLRERSSLTFDVHLMISDPLRYVDDFIDAGADIITFHLESTPYAAQIIDKIKKGGALPALSMKPSTPEMEIFPYLDKIYMALVMTVEPGFGGQAFLPETLPKIEKLRKEIEKRGLDTNIQVDGGIGSETVALAAKNGANAFAVGSAVFGAPDRKAAIALLRKKAAEAQASLPIKSTG